MHCNIHRVCEHLLLSQPDDKEDKSELFASNRTTDVEDSVKDLGSQKAVEVEDGDGEEMGADGDEVEVTTVIQVTKIIQSMILLFTTLHLDREHGGGKGRNKRRREIETRTKACHSSVTLKDSKIHLKYFNNSASYSLVAKRCPI